MINLTAPTGADVTLGELLAYDSETGVLTWRGRPRELFVKRRAWARWNTCFAGKDALATPTIGGYRHGRIFYKQYKAHRVIWALVYGEWPEEVDHINGVRADNRLANLRAVTRSENMRNKKRHRNNTSGVVGVSWDEPDAKWRVQIQAEGCRIHLGLFSDFNAAVAARNKADKQYGFHKNHGRAA